MNKIGIDAGGSLIKLNYEEKGQIHFKTYPLKELEKLTNWLQWIAPQATIYGTGGNWRLVKEKLHQPNEDIDEFTALVKGTNYLLETEKKRLDEYILVSIGTGTSIFHVNRQEFSRVVGTGIGGGTWMGIGNLLAGEKTFAELVKLSLDGNHKRSDLLVQDIYGLDNAPLTNELTAANFGKEHLTKDATVNDQLRALTQMIGEVILTLTGTVIQQINVTDVVFTGSTLEGNTPLQEVFTSFHDVLTYQPIFLEKGAYAGAVGAMIS